VRIAEAANPATEQQKMKVCNEKWEEERASTGANRREGLQEFLSACLKSGARLEEGVERT
jgi:hypothetical protein